MKKLLIGARNKGKLSEIKKDLRGLNLEIISLNDLDDDYDVEEPAMTLEGNAILKAIIYGKRFGLPCLVDDTGLEIKALDGFPGVKSARWMEGTDRDKYEAILKKLEDKVGDDRAAQFRTVIAIYDPAIDKIRTCEGVCKGVIANEPIGENGFGYDPVFYYPPKEKTLAEMNMNEKNIIGHRGNALKTAKEIIKNQFSII